jgi:hypothetical protein
MPCSCGCIPWTKESQVKIITVQINLFSRPESNGHGIHLETPIDTSTVQEQRFQMGKA